MESLQWHKVTGREDINFVVEHVNISEFDKDLITRIVFDGEVSNYVPREVSVIDLLVMAGFFPSKGEARRNWKGPIKLEEGFSEFKHLGKFKRSLFVLKVPDNFPVLEA